MLPRWMPEWIGPAAYLAGILILGLVGLGLLQLLSNDKSSAGVRASQLSKTVTAPEKSRRRIHDTPETFSELSPLYPTPRYSLSASGSQADFARKLARDHPVKPRARQKTLAQEEGSFAFGYQPETTGSGRSNFFSKPEPIQ